jgi:hypothetical protein
MRIAILGWGSLIWDPRDLPRQGNWQEGGPKLPIEFSRVSSGKRLTLVIDPDGGVLVPTRFVMSSRADLDNAVCDLSEREETTPENIGFVDLMQGAKRSSVYLEAGDIIERWARVKRFDAVIWTDLPSNFKRRTGFSFTLERAVEYLKRLSGSEAVRAREYIAKAPPEVDTPLRRELGETSWAGD